MNNAKMWLVVKPTVGIPLFLTGVAVASFAVHLAVLSKTNWYSDYLIGADLGSGEGMAFFNRDGDKSDSVQQAAYTRALENGAKEVTIVLPDGTTAKALLQPDVVASR